MLGSRIPDEDLARIGAPNDQVGVERRKSDGQDVRLRMKDKLWAFEHVQVPDADDALGFLDGQGVSVISRYRQLRKLQIDRSVRCATVASSKLKHLW